MKIVSEYEAYQLLIYNICLKAIADYITSGGKDYDAIRFFKSPWFTFLTGMENGEEILEKAWKNRKKDDKRRCK